MTGALPGNTRVTREDWLRVAKDALVSEGVEAVKILALGQRLGVSRSSFYGYFENRQDLLDALLRDWEETNTSVIRAHCDMDADTITAAVCNLFLAFLDPGAFDPRLDFAVREWARRSDTVRRVVDRSDEARLRAIRAMYLRHGYTADEAATRARVLYYMQIGYYALELQETLEMRLSYIPGYLYCFTGKVPLESEIARLAERARAARHRREPA